MRKLLEETRRLLANGWCKDQFVNTKGEYCLAGAFNAAQNNLQVDCYEGAVARLLVGEHYKVRAYHGLISFNDHPATTKEDVLGVLDAVIAGLV